MAFLTNVLRTCGFIVYLVFTVNAVYDNSTGPWIMSMKVVQKNCDAKFCKYYVLVHGGEFLGQLSWRLTPTYTVKGGNCDVIHSNYEINVLNSDSESSRLEILLPINDTKIYLCTSINDGNSPLHGKWMHQGVEFYLEPINNFLEGVSGEMSITRETTESNHENFLKFDLSSDTDVNYSPNQPKLTYEESNDVEIKINDKYVPLNNYKESVDQIELNNLSSGKYKRSSDDENINSSDNNKNNDRIDEFNVDNNREMTPSNNKDASNNYIELNSEKVLNKFNSNLFNDDVELHNKIDNEGLVKNSLRNISNIVHKSDLFVNSNDVRNEALNEYIKNQTNNDLIHAVPSDDAVIFEDLNYNDFDDLLRNKDGNILNDNGLRDFTRYNNIIVDKIDHDVNDKNEKVVSNELPLDGKEEGKRRIPRQLNPEEFISVKAVPVVINLEGVRIEDSEKDPKLVENGIPSVLADSAVTIRIFGDGITSRTVIALTQFEQVYGQPCKFLLKGEYMVKEGSLKPKTALFDITVPSPNTGSKLYICAKNLRPASLSFHDDEEKYIHQGNETYKIFESHNPLLPLWFSLTLILVCLMFSALFSGLNLGLMSLDRTELKIISNTGTEQERKYARAIMPVRDHGNYLLCSILLGNVAVNSTFTILLDELTSGLFAVIVSTLAIVLLGEITPQAICSRHGLMVGAKSIMITKSVMALTAPLAFPISKLLDYFLGEEIGNVYNRERLKELIKLTTGVNDLDKDEVNIISGALELRKKKVSEVMTKLEDVFMLPITSILDFETMSEIIKSGYSRIPVYEGNRGDIVTVLFIKDLAFVDPDDNTPLRTLCQYYQNPCNFVFEDVTLDVMFKQFKEGHKGHMAFVHRINNEGEGDPFYETIGLVTLEDVIEEMIQAEIVDETDVFMDNRTKRRRNRPQNKLQDFAAFAERHENQRIHISPQLTLATFQFLSTSVDAFRPDTVSETVLRRLLGQDVIQHIKVKGKSKKDPSTFVFQQGKPVDYFVLILEGRVEVTVGRENLVFEAGPFTYFGVQALTQNVGVAESPTPSAMGSLQNINMDSMLRHTFVPDYSVRAITELFYLTVKRSLYLAAKRATLMEKGALSKGATNEQFDTEVDKQLCNSSATIPISMISKKLLGRSNSIPSTSNDDHGAMYRIDKLLQSVDEDISITGERHSEAKTPSRQVSPNPVPVSASPHTRASFTSRTSADRNGDVYATSRADEQEKLLK